jgi:hypothetical protein
VTNPKDGAGNQGPGDDDGDWRFHDGLSKGARTAFARENKQKVRPDPEAPLIEVERECYLIALASVEWFFYR